MPETFPRAESGDALSADFINRHSDVARRTAKYRGGFGIRAGQTTDTLGISGETPVLQVPLEIVDIPDPHLSGSDAELGRHLYHVRLLEFNGTEWAARTIGPTYLLDAAIGSVTFEIGDRLHGYWHRRRQTFLPLNSGGGSSPPPVCQTLADYGNLYGQFDITYDASEITPEPDATVLLPTFIVAMELSRGADPPTDPNAPPDKDWVWSVPNLRVMHLTTPWHTEYDVALPESHAAGTVTGLYTFAIRSGYTYARMRVGARLPDDTTVTVGHCAMRFEIKGRGFIRDEGSTFRLEAYGGGFYQYVNIPGWSEEASLDNQVEQTEIDENSRRCPYFQPYGDNYKYIEMIVPVADDTRTALDAAAADTLGIVTDADEDIVDDEDDPIYTAEQIADLTELENDYLPVYLVEAEIQFTISAVERIDTSDQSSASESPSSASSISTSSSSRSSSSVSSQSSISTSSSSLSASSASSLSSVSSPSSLSSSSSPSSSSLSSYSSTSSSLSSVEDESSMSSTSSIIEGLPE